MPLPQQSGARTELIPNIDRTLEHLLYNCPGDLFLVTSVVDPNTLNLDPDPGFWPNLDPDPDPELCYQFWKKN